MPQFLLIAVGMVVCWVWTQAWGSHALAGPGGGEGLVGVGTGATQAESTVPSTMPPSGEGDRKTGAEGGVMVLGQLPVTTVILQKS